MPAEPAPLTRPLTGQMHSWYVSRARFCVSVQVQLTTHLRRYNGNLTLPGRLAWTLKRASQTSHSIDIRDTEQCPLPRVRSCHFRN